MKKTFLLLFALLPMMLSAQNLTPKRHHNKWLYGYWGEKKNGKEGFVIKPKFEKTHPFVGEYAFVRYKGLWGIIGKDGKFVVEPKYSSASKPYNGITIVQLGSKYGLVRDCKDILRIEYESIEHLKTGAFRLKKDGRVGLADASGKIFLPVEYEDIADYNGGYKLKANGKCGLADVSGRIFLPVEYEDIADYNGGYKLKANSKYGLADVSGKIFLPVEYEDIADYNGGYKLKANDKYGLADASGKIFIPVEYEDIEKYGAGYKLKANSKYGLADASGKIVLEVKCKEILSLQDNLFAVYADKWAFINGDGDTFEQPSNVLLYTSTDGKTINRSRSGNYGDYYYYWQVNVVSNTCHNGQGIMVFNKPITSIGDWAFCNCDGLTSVTIGNGVTSIGRSAFEDCSRLTSVTIGNGVTSIGNRAFSGCSSLKSITIPDSVTKIGEEAFPYCDNPTRVNVHISDLARYCTSNPMSKIRGSKHLYINGREITNLVIPNGVTSIGDYAFCGCHSLTSVTIGNSVTSIGNRAFSGCSSLKSITIPNSVTEIGEGAFYYCRSLRSITIPNSVTKIGSSAFEDCHGLISVTIGGGAIEQEAFKNCSSLKNVTLGNKVTEIGSAFWGCTGLTSITIPDSVTSIGGAFWGCTGLTSITIPDSVTSIGWGAFNGCSRLTRVNVHISDLARYCTSNPMHSIPGEKHLYLNGKEITNLVIPNSVTSIGWWAFDGCTSLKSVTIPNSVTSIEYGAFQSCTGLTSITLPKSLTLIDARAFYGCTALKAVYLNATIPPYLGKEVFDYDAGRICCPIYVPSSSLSRYKGVGGNWRSYYQYLRGR